MLSTIALIQNVKKKFSLARLAYKNNISTNEKITSLAATNRRVFDREKSDRFFRNLNHGISISSG